MSAAAASRVFDITELTTYILQLSDPISLLTSARGVCKTWQRIIETDPVILWRIWGNSAYGDNPPKSVRNSYINKNCRCTSPPEFDKDPGTSDKDVKPKDEKSGSETKLKCTDHAYTDLYELNPIAFHLIELVWKRIMRGPDQSDSDDDDEQAQQSPTTDDTSENVWKYQLMCSYIEGKMEQYSYMQDQLKTRHLSNTMKKAKDNGRDIVIASQTGVESGLEYCPTHFLIRPVCRARGMLISPGAKTTLTWDHTGPHPPRAGGVLYGTTLEQAIGKDGSVIGSLITIEDLLRDILESLPRPSILKLPNFEPGEDTPPEIYSIAIRIFGERWRRRLFSYSKEDEKRVIESNAGLRAMGVDPDQTAGWGTPVQSDRVHEFRGGLEHTEFRVRLSVVPPYNLVGVERRRFVTLETVDRRMRNATVFEYT